MRIAEDTLLDRTPCGGIEKGVPALVCRREQGVRATLTKLYLSCLTVGELTKGITHLPASARKHRLQDWVRDELARRFEGRILEVDTDVAARWGVLTGEAENRGEPLPAIDSLMATTALHHDLTVVTRNATDMRRCGVKVLNPWEGKAGRG